MANKLRVFRCTITNHHGWPQSVVVCLCERASQSFKEAFGVLATCEQYGCCTVTGRWRADCDEFVGGAAVSHRGIQLKWIRPEGLDTSVAMWKSSLHPQLNRAPPTVRQSDIARFTERTKSYNPNVLVSLPNSSMCACMRAWELVHTQQAQSE